MVFKRTIRGIRDKIPAGYVLGRAAGGNGLGARGQGPVQLIKFNPNSSGAIGSSASTSTTATTIAIEIYAGSTMSASEAIGQIIAPVQVTLLVGLPDSYAKAGVASTGTLVLNIRKATAVGGRGSVIGTITFTTSATGVISFLTETVFAPGDRLIVECPAVPDSTLADTTILIVGTL